MTLPDGFGLCVFNEQGAGKTAGAAQCRFRIVQSASANPLLSQDAGFRKF
jgi:hypothetical protein